MRDVVFALHLCVATRVAQLNRHNAKQSVPRSPDYNNKMTITKCEWMQLIFTAFPLVRLVNDIPITLRAHSIATSHSYCTQNTMISIVNQSKWCWHQDMGYANFTLARLHTHQRHATGLLIRASGRCLIQFIFEIGTVLFAELCFA